MQIRAFGKTDVGRKRGHNEDFLLLEPDLGLHVVCDGMGGHAAGEVASEMAAATVQSTVNDGRSAIDDFDGSEAAVDKLVHLMRTAVERASEVVYNAASEGHGRHGMGTTCVSLLIVQGKGIMAHVGDSRLYLHRGGQVYQLSADHTYLNEAIRNGLMTPEQAADSPHAHVVTRAVGVAPSVAVDTLAFDVLPGDTYLLCSDGFHDYLEDLSELAEWLSNDSTDIMPDRLVEVANVRGGADNVTTLVVRASLEDASESVRKTQVENNLATLRHIALFMDMEMPELVRVMAAFERTTHEAGDTIILEGESSDTLFVIVSGELEVARSGAPLCLLPAGSHFGEMALLNQRARTATVTARQPAELLVLDRDHFNDLLRQDPGVACKFLYKLAQVLSLRLDETNALADDAQRRTQELGVLSPFRRGGAIVRRRR